jgi:hypothetical protein
MSRLLNKKEEVIELKLTSYGKYLLGAGTFKPMYYAFLDDNIIYDAAHAGIDETQSSAQKRIKEETQYLESLVLFEDLENYTLQDEIDEIQYMPGDVKPREEIQVSEFYRFDHILGDAYLLGEQSVTPSWKVAALQTAISSSSFTDAKNNTRIPQINISSSYTLRTMDVDKYTNTIFNSEEPLDHILKTTSFRDDKIIYLDRSEPTMYIEEVNTQTLNKNFDVEVFEFVERKQTGQLTGSKNTFQFLTRKYYHAQPAQIVDGIMMSAKKKTKEVDPNTLSPQTVDYYFNILRDKEIDRELACKGADRFNKQSYYIDLDFNCRKTRGNQDINVDIYGQGSVFDGDPGGGDPYGNNAGEPEICHN